MFSLLSSLLHPQSDEERRVELYRDIIRRAARAGGRVFGPIPEGTRREFFCLDEHTWVWHEEWVDEKRQHHVVTTRYDVRPQGILKAQDNQPYQYISNEEAQRFRHAVQLYNDMVQSGIPS